MDVTFAQELDLARRAATAPSGRVAMDRIGVPVPLVRPSKGRLAASRVDLLARTAGQRQRVYVPGTNSLIPAGARLHISAPAKSGKSIALLATAVQVVAAGGRVVLLDRENGADETARRLASILETLPGDLADLIAARLIYHAWPDLSGAWTPATWTAEFPGVDLVVIDSSRSHTASLGLKEDSSDDWASFAATHIDPLAQAGIAVVTLDNTGHADSRRARGSSAKGDLADLVLHLTAARGGFSEQSTGELTLRCERSRFGEIATGDSWHMQIGGGVFGAWERRTQGGAPTSAKAAPDPDFLERVSRAIEDSPRIGSRELRNRIQGRNEKISAAVEWLDDHGYIDVSDGNGPGTGRPMQSIDPYRADAAHRAPTGSRPCPNNGAGTDTRANLAPGTGALEGPGPGTVGRNGQETEEQPGSETTVLVSDDCGEENDSGRTSSASERPGARARTRETP